MNVCNPTDVNWTNAWQTHKYLAEQVLKSWYWQSWQLSFHMYTSKCVLNEISNFEVKQFKKNSKQEL